jgi:hypothetical protein
MKKAIFSSIVWVMDAMVNGMCPNVGDTAANSAGKTVHNSQPVLATVATGQIGGPVGA